MSREISSQPCRDCGAPTLVGLSDDYCAHIAHVDPWPIDTLGEMYARLAGAETYDLHRELNGFRLYERDHWQIRNRPAGSLTPGWRVDVLADHRCGQTWPTTTSNFQFRNSIQLDPHAPPPF